MIPSLGKNLCCVIFHEVSSEVSSYFKSQPRIFPQPTQNPGFLDDESIFTCMSKIEDPLYLKNEGRNRNEVRLNWYALGPKQTN